MKKWFLKGFIIFSGIMISTGLGIWAFQNNTKEPQADPRLSSVWKTYFDLPQKSLLYRRFYANNLALFHSIYFFAMGERRLPSSFEELVNSVYFPVISTEFVNPYTGKPVQNIPKPKIEKREINGHKSLVVIDKNPADVLGNLTFEINMEGIKYTWYFQLDGESGIIRAIEENSKTRRLIPTPGSLLAGVAEDVEKNVKPSQLSLEDRRLYYRCEYIRFLVGNALYYGFKIPLSWEELKATGIVLDVKNPYTGQPIQDVSYYSPSPGNFTYIGIFEPNDLSHFSLALPICYNREKKSIDPIADILVKQHLKWEADGTFRDKNKQPVRTKLVLIH